MAKSEERKNTEKIFNEAKGYEQLQKNISAALESKLKFSNEDLKVQTKLNAIQKDITNSILQHEDIEQKLTKIAEEKRNIIDSIYDTNNEVAKQLLTQLEESEKLLKTEKMRKDVTETLNGLGESFTQDLAGALGISEDLLNAIKNMSIAMLGLYVLKEIVGMFTDSVQNVRKLNKEMGMSVGNAIRFEANIRQAQFSFEGLIYSADEFRESAMAVVEATGNISVPPETIKDVTKINALLKDPQASVSLQRTLQNAGVDAGNLTDDITEMANKLGVDASSAMEFLAENQLELGGMTEQQIKQRAEESLMLKKMGADMKELNRLAGEALDIESSLKNEMKLRMMTGKEINLNELRAAQASGDAVAIGQAQAKLVSQLGDDLHSNLQIQRLITDATGMSKDQLLSYNNASKENQKAQDDLLALKEKFGLADVEQAKQLQANLAQDEARLETIKGIAMWGGIAAGVIGGVIFALKKFVFKGDSKKGNPISNFFKSMGTKEVLMGAAAMLVISAALSVTASALMKFNEVDWGSLGKAGLALIGLVASVSALGLLMSSGVGAVAILAGAAAMLVIASSLLVLGSALQSIGSGFDMMGSGLTSLTDILPNLSLLIPTLGTLVLMAPGLIALSGALTILSASLLTLSVGLAAVSVFLPVLGALSSVGLFGGESEDSSGGESGMSELLGEIKGLRQDVQTQPIMINVDGRVVSQISRVQRKQNSVSTSGYGR